MTKKVLLRGEILEIDGNKKPAVSNACSDITARLIPGRVWPDGSSGRG
jgi:hypothetical protein